MITQLLCSEFVREIFGEINGKFNQYRNITVDYWPISETRCKFSRNPDCVVMDNFRFHHGHSRIEPVLRNILANGDVRLLFQPPYPQHFNSCEYRFNEIKACLRFQQLRCSTLLSTARMHISSTGTLTIANFAFILLYREEKNFAIKVLDILIYEGNISQLVKFH